MIPLVATELRDVIDAAAPDNVTVLDHVPMTPPVPCVWIEWATSADMSTSTLAGNRDVVVNIVCAAGLGDGRAAQVAIGELIHSTIPAALEAHSPTTYRFLELGALGPAAVTEERHLQQPLSVSITY